MRSTLRRKTIVNLGLMVSGAMLTGAAAIFGVNGIRDDMNIALQGNQQLRQVYEIGLDATTARRALSASHPNRAAALAAVEMGLAKLDGADYRGPNATVTWLDESKKAECRLRLKVAALELDQPPVGSNDLLAAQSTVNGLIGELANLSSDVRRTITSKQQAAEDQREHTMLTIIALVGVVVIAAIAIGLRQYRSVMQPLNSIGRGVRRFAAGQLGERIEPIGDLEFVALANDFNRMAGELEGFYRQLEEKVAAKSKELVRSERLASVGYLAAGVAHEMNNPLGIIAGYGERSLQHMARPADETTLPSAKRAIRIMTEEAFRCKAITERLLSLARPGSGNHRPVSVAVIVQEVISNLSGLPDYADRRITLEIPTEGDWVVMGKDGELRQVMVNLLLNALQATSPETGEVHISVAAVGDEIEISICDNGNGMTPQTLDRVFEPFFTDKRGQQAPGTGLGLSITHAIVLDHGGRITAESDGPGEGSRFRVRLPAGRAVRCEEGAAFADVA